MRRGSTKNRALDFWLGVPLLNLVATLRRRRKPPKRWHRVGVICSPALGDTLLLSGVLEDLRAHCARMTEACEIVHFCMRSNLAAAELLAGADRRVLINLTEIPATMRAMRRERLDVMLDFTSWQRLTAFFTLVSGARFTVGFETPGQHRSRGYDLTVKHTDDRHEVENFRAILAAIGIPAGAMPQVVVPDLPPDAPEALAEETDLVVFHLWASGQRSWLREWPQERWAELAGRLARPETMFVITGAPSDLSRSEPFLDRMTRAGLRATAFVGSDGFRSLARMLRRARVVVSVNTGVMHLAAILGAPTVAIKWAEPQWTMGAGGAASLWRGSARRRLRIPSPGLQLRRQCDGLHGKDYGGEGGAGRRSGDSPGRRTDLGVLLETESMDAMREILRKDLGRTLKALPELDRLQAAWTVACGKLMAGHGRIAGFDGGVLSIEVESSVWMGQMLSMRGTLEREVAKIAEVKLAGIHFYLRRNAGSERG